MSNAHSVMPPSNLYRTVQCSGNITMPADPTLAGDNEASAEGSGAHWALAEVLQGRPAWGLRAPNGVLIDEEIRESVEFAHDAFESLLEEFDQTIDNALIEHRVQIPRIHAECWGTLDFGFWAPDRKTVVVVDFKHGHEAVEVFENLQLLAYSSGLLGDAEVRVVNVIVQPRAQHRDGPVRRWTYHAVDARGLLNICMNAAHEALGPDPKLRAGPACRHCHAATTCPALTKAAGRVMDEAYRPIPDVLDANRVGVELRYAQRSLALLKSRADALEQQALAMARAGANVPHFLVEKSAGREVWKKPAAEVIALGQMLGLDLAKPPAAITPLQAAGRGLSDVLRASFAERTPGASQLVPDDGSRFRKVFGQ